MTRFLAAVCVISLTACASVFEQRMAFNDLDTFQVDCSRKYEQMAFLQSQLPTSNERMLASLSMNFPEELTAHFKGETTENRRLKNREYEAVIRGQLHKLEMCPDAKPVAYPSNIDCANKYAKIRWLENQISKNEARNATIKRTIWEYHSSCVDVN